MEERQVKSLARTITHQIVIRHIGDIEDPASWIQTAASFGCRVHAYHAPGGDLGEYASCGDGQGVITYNAAVSPPAQARIIAHELAHHLLMPLVPGYLFGDYVRCHYDDDPADVRHRIARQVEFSLF